MAQKTRGFGPPVRGYPGQRRREGTVPNNVALTVVLLLFILLVEVAYVVHVW